VARYCITGSSDASASWRRILIDQGHEVVLPRAKTRWVEVAMLSRAAAAMAELSRGPLTIAGPKTVADEVNKLGRFDAVIHNAGVGSREGRVEMEPEFRASCCQCVRLI